MMIGKLPAQGKVITEAFDSFEDKNEAAEGCDDDLWE